MGPKLPTRPKHMEVRKGYEYVPGERDSEQLPPVFESIVDSVKSLERDRNELQNMRATLIVNFGPNGKAGLQCGITIEDASEKGSLTLLVMILEKLFERAMSNTK